ncbi:MAG TPA: DUF3105 domain-containing protein [Gaiellaceae bacterium]|nr:DUF3105 domain-containing protein [Gaiellaceae bacterium]
MQAPQQRSTPRGPRESRTFLYVLAFAALGVILLGGVLALVAFGGDDGGSAAIESQVCKEESFPGLEPEHLSSPDGNVTYNSFPPSSGPHYQQAAPWGIYEDPIKQTILVHNLEHGGIVIQYGDVGEETVKDIQSFYQDDPYGLVVAPYPKLGKKIAFTAWNEPRYARNESEPGQVDAGDGHVMTCTEWDADAAKRFRDERRNKAGERYGSVQDMSPGS